MGAGEQEGVCQAPNNQALTLLLWTVVARGLLGRKPPAIVHVQEKAAGRGQGLNNQTRNRQHPRSCHAIFTWAAPDQAAGTSWQVPGAAVAAAAWTCVCVQKAACMKAHLLLMAWALLLSCARTVP